MLAVLQEDTNHLPWKTAVVQDLGHLHTLLADKLSELPGKYQENPLVHHPRGGRGEMRAPPGIDFPVFYRQPTRSAFHPTRASTCQLQPVAE